MFRPFVLSVSQDLCILLLAAVHSSHFTVIRIQPHTIITSWKSQDLYTSTEIRWKKTNIREEKTLGRAAQMVWIKVNRHTACDWPLKIISFGSPRKKKNGEEQPKSSLSNQYRIVTPTFQYNMDYKKVGKCIIINNKNFEDKTGNVLPLMILITD